MANCFLQIFPDFPEFSSGFLFLHYDGHNFRPILHLDDFLLLRASLQLRIRHHRYCHFHTRPVLSTNLCLLLSSQPHTEVPPVPSGQGTGPASSVSFSDPIFSSDLLSVFLSYPVSHTFNFQKGAGKNFPAPLPSGLLCLLSFMFFIVSGDIIR